MSFFERIFGSGKNQPEKKQPEQPKPSEPRVTPAQRTAEVGLIKYHIVCDDATTRLAEQAHQFHPGEGFAILITFEEAVSSLCDGKARKSLVIRGTVKCVCKTTYPFEIDYIWDAGGPERCPSCGKETHLGTASGRRAPVGDKALIITVTTNDRRRVGVSIDSILPGKGEGVFGRSEKSKPAVPANTLAQSDREATAVLVAEALKIIEAQVRISRGAISVQSSGSEGKAMEAARKLEQAHKLHPENALLHYAYASALDLAAQGSSAAAEMKRLADSNPGFLLARFATASQDRGKYPLFTLPPWGPASTSVHPAISATVKTGVLIAVRDGLTPRAALFVRDAQGDFQDAQALESARIDITTMISPITKPQIVALYANVWDNPRSPYTIEAFDLPLGPRGSKGRLNYEFLCLQEDIDFAVIDRSDRILLNKRISIPPAMQQTNRQILKLLTQAPDGPEVSDAQLHNALTEHKCRVPLSAVRYSSEPAGSDPRKAAEGSHGNKRATPTMTDRPKEKESVGSSTSFTATQADLIVELVTLVKRDNSGFANRPRIREIGQELNRQGGMKLMQQAYYKVRATGAYFSQDIWHEIGEWEQ
jgi:hypothetical protein